MREKCLVVLCRCWKQLAVAMSENHTREPYHAEENNMPMKLSVRKHVNDFAYCLFVQLDSIRRRNSLLCYLNIGPFISNGIRFLHLWLLLQVQ